MIKFARLGPSSFHTGKYHFENWLQKPMGGSIMIEYELLKIIWWVLVGVLLIGLPHRWF